MSAVPDGASVPDLATSWRVALYESVRIQRQGQPCWVPGWRPAKVRLSWEGLRAGLTRFRPATAKAYVPCWSPGVPAGDRRCNEDVREVSCLVLDLDSGADWRSVTWCFSGYRLVAHSSWSTTADKPKGRIVLPLASPVPVRYHARAWWWAQRMSGDAMDPATKDPARLYYLPATDGQREHQAWAEEGQLLDLRPWDDLPLTPEEEQEEERKRRAAELPAPRYHGLQRFSGEERKQRFGRAVLARLCGEVAETTALRNRALARAAFTAGGWVAGGVMTASDALHYLTDAGLHTGLSLEEVKGVVEHQIVAGQSRPLTMPEEP